MGALRPAGKRIGGIELWGSEWNGSGAGCLDAMVLVTSVVGRLRGGRRLPLPAPPPMGGRGELMASGPTPRGERVRVGENG